MHLIRKTALAVCGWLTAAMTLVAGFPHLECLCPDGHRKAFCLGQVSRSSGCCCGGSCCSSSSGGGCCCARAKTEAGPQSKGRCCARHSSRKISATPGKHPQVQHPGCSRTVAPAKTWTASSPRTAAAKEGIAKAIFPPPPAPVAAPAVTASGRGPWQIHLLGPPTDRVILDQHFLL